MRVLYGAVLEPPEIRAQSGVPPLRQRLCGGHFETISDARPTKESSVSDMILGNSYKYTLGQDLEKARMRKLVKSGKFPKGLVHSQRLRDAAVSADFPEMPEHGDN
jgi:hypothetical protein